MDADHFTLSDDWEEEGVEMDWDERFDILEDRLYQCAGSTRSRSKPATDVPRRRPAQRRTLQLELMAQTKARCRQRAEDLNVRSTGAPAPVTPSRRVQLALANKQRQEVRALKCLYEQSLPVLPIDGAMTVTTERGLGTWFRELATAGESPREIVARSTVETSLTRPEDRCNICLGDFGPEEPAIRLPSCPAQSHWFHPECILMGLAAQQRCPCCFAACGVMMGTMPSGTMFVSTLPGALPGHAGHATIRIQYCFPSGVQGPEHPHPGTGYQGTTRTAYLPDSPRGRRVLHLMQVAWDRRLLFTVGRSVTTGMDNSVVWAGIHHKTESGPGGAFGYPDATYLDRVEAELAAVGVTVSAAARKLPVE